MAATALFVSSGDLVLDRRYQWALNFLDRGDVVAATDVLQQLVEAAPAFATAWFALGAIRARLGDRNGAIVAFGAARDADIEDYLGARLHLARLGVGEATPSMSAQYVQRLFDQHATAFDEALVERLDYRGPQIIRAALEALADGPLRFRSVLDLGCGTGLGGVAFRDVCGRLIGVDVSGGMIEQAQAKAVYDELVVAELSDYLAASAGARHDVVIAADVFVYCRDLAPIASTVAGVLAPGGLFAFTVESLDGTGVVLRESLRYAHSSDHVRGAIAAAGMELKCIDTVSTRTERGEPVDGLVVVASR